MTLERQCKTCKRVFPETLKYFYRTQGDYLMHQCKQCKNRRDAAYNRERRRAIREQTLRIPKQTPKHITTTPEYQAFKVKRRMLEQRLQRARAAGEVRNVALMSSWLEGLKSKWYESIALRGA